jgi:hypothetical protein
MDCTVEESEGARPVGSGTDDVGNTPFYFVGMQFLGLTQMDCTVEKKRKKPHLEDLVLVMLATLLFVS